MDRRKWFFLAPILLLSGMLGRSLLVPVISRGAERRIMSTEAEALQARLGYHLYAPSWLPYGGRPGSMGAVQGAVRVLQDFTDDQDRTLIIIAQEQRTPKRDNYNHSIFVDRAEAKGVVRGIPCYFVTGPGGERRLFWNEPEAAVIISSTFLKDKELLDIAKKIE